MLEDLGKAGRVILIDGAPVLLKRLFLERLPPDVDVEEVTQAMVLQTGFKFAFPNDSGDRMMTVLTEKGWDAKLKKIDELYSDFVLYSKEYSFKMCTSLFHRLMVLNDLNIDELPQLETPIDLIKPSIKSIQTIDDDYGLKVHSKNEIEIRTIEGDHMSILDNKDLSNILNNAF